MYDYYVPIKDITKSLKMIFEGHIGARVQVSFENT
jgi:hypothetical protein